MRRSIEILDRQFSQLHKRSVSLVASVPPDELYRRTAADGDLMMKLTVGENIIRSAAFVELTFGGITTRLWDDPFEWTLAEALHTGELITDYLSAVEATRVKGFGYFQSDEDLTRSIPAPREFKPILEVLVETLAKAEYYQGRATAILQMNTSAKLRPR